VWLSSLYVVLLFVLKLKCVKRGSWACSSPRRDAASRIPLRRRPSWPPGTRAAARKVAAWPSLLFSPTGSGGRDRSGPAVGLADEGRSPQWREAQHPDPAAHGQIRGLRGGGYPFLWISFGMET
jgi:hypothetical protein